jgi:hypothetical protein
MVMSESKKSLETRLRRVAKQEGLRILKSRLRHQRADNLCLYQLIEDRRNIVVPKYDATLEDIAKYLAQEHRDALKWQRYRRLLKGRQP